jgi:hypothetical protein
VQIASTGFAALFNLMIFATASGGAPQQDAARDSLYISPRMELSLDDQKEIAGLPRASKPELITWEKAYALALVRARSGGGALVPSLDPAALSRQADRLGAADFARFRNDFVASGPFRDPAPDMLALSARLQMIENARCHLIFLEILGKLLQERIQGESSGLSRLDLDIVFAAFFKGRQNFDHQKTLFRDGLDEFKVALGLSPQAEVILDRKPMAGFEEVFEAVATWLRQPSRRLDALFPLTDTVPELGDFILDGKPALGPLQANPDQWVDALPKAARLALARRGDSAQGATEADARVRLELKIRRRVRRLVELRGAHAYATQQYAMAIRVRDQAFERLLAPRSDGSPSRSQLLEQIVDQAAGYVAIEDQLVELWTSFRAERLTLYREIGVLPYADWKAFYADLSARRAALKDAPAADSAPPAPPPGAPVGEPAGPPPAAPDVKPAPPPPSPEAP